MKRMNVIGHTLNVKKVSALFAETRAERSPNAPEYTMNVSGYTNGTQTQKWDFENPVSH